MNYILYTLDNQFIMETDEYPYKFTGIIAHIDRLKSWRVDGERHRLDGPAVEWCDGLKLWFIHGKRVTEEQHSLLHSIMKLKGLI